MGTLSVYLKRHVLKGGVESWSGVLQTFYWWRKLVYPKKTTDGSDLSQVTDKLYPKNRKSWKNYVQIKTTHYKIST
jgi:hypothetical protein